MIKRCIDTREVDEDDLRRSLLMKILKEFFDRENNPVVVIAELPSAEAKKLSMSSSVVN
jgi:hypothetical protein